MDFVVHGTKGGYKTLFKSNEALNSSLFDIRSDNPPESTLGEEAYAIRSFQNKIIYSKYKIIRDVAGDKRTGFIGFSLFVSKNEKIEPRNILKLLDGISGKYFELYVKDNNLDSVNESWSFVEDIIKIYNPIIKPTTFEIPKSGLVDDAVVYYNTKDELDKNWQKGFMSHYTKFRQVLYISEDLRSGDKNPVRAIRNSGEEIDINKFSTTQQFFPKKIAETTEPDKPGFPNKTILILSAALILIFSIVLFVVSMDSDTDGDGVSNDQDQCPNDYGLLAFAGCPDTDGDSVKDSDDRCPDVPGLLDLYGCPDTDGDGVSNDQDQCPNVFGLLTFAGCPDTDGDGVKDSDDRCIDVPGSPDFDGCPRAGSNQVIEENPRDISEPPAALSINGEQRMKLRGNEISKEELNDLKSNPNFIDDEILVRSIGLYLKFFEVSKKNLGDDYESLYKKVRKDEILKESQLKQYLKKISRSGSEGDKLRLKIEEAQSNRLKTLKQFQEKIN